MSNIFLLRSLKRKVWIVPRDKDAPLLGNSLQQCYFSSSCSEDFQK